MSATIEVTDTPDEAALSRIETELAAFNDADVGPSEKATLAILVRDERGAVVAGISGYTAWGWLHVQKLWVDESLRGQGMAGRMLTAAEEEAERRGCMVPSSTRSILARKRPIRARAIKSSAGWMTFRKAAAASFCRNGSTQRPAINGRSFHRAAARARPSSWGS